MLKSGERVSFSSIAALISFLVFAAGITPGADRPNALAVNTSKVTSITQLTHDGVSKTNLLSDDSNLYVTEWPAARHLVAKVSRKTAVRSVIPTAFSNVQALDISSDHTKLLVSPMQGGTSDNEFWTLPITAG